MPNVQYIDRLIEHNDKKTISPSVARAEKQFANRLIKMTRSQEPGDNAQDAVPDSSHSDVPAESSPAPQLACEYSDKLSGDRSPLQA
jgi:hypothetical protein